MQNPEIRHRVIRPSRAVEKANEPPIYVNKQGAIQITGIPGLLADLESDKLVVSLTEGPRKCYSIVNLKRAVLEKRLSREDSKMLSTVARLRPVELGDRQWTVYIAASSKADHAVRCEGRLLNSERHEQGCRQTVD